MFIRYKFIPTQIQVRQVNIDTRVASAPADIMPRARPHLHKIQPKDPVEAENAGYVRVVRLSLSIMILSNINF